MYKRILVPMENEEQQEAALNHARALAKHTGATVVVAWLVPVLASEERFFSQIQVEPGSSGARRVEKGEAYLAQTREAFRDSSVAIVTKVVVTPLPLEQAILDVAKEEEADLIILTTLPESAVGRFLFGSVAEKVRRRSSIPTLFINPLQVDGREV